MGSSFELSQRLEEPGSFVIGHHDSPLQIFDIRRRATETWKELRDRTRQRESMSELDQPASERAQDLRKINESIPPWTAQSVRSRGDPVSPDARKSWLNACQPPKLYQKPNSEASYNPYTGMTTTLTAEGQRQVRFKSNM